MKVREYYITNLNNTFFLIERETQLCVFKSKSETEVDQYFESKQFMFPSLLNRIRFFFFRK